MRHTAQAMISKSPATKAACILICLISSLTAASADDSGAIAFFQQHGGRITTDDKGHAIKLFVGGKPALSVDELQRIGELTHLQELAINAAPANDDQWEFLKSLNHLRKLTLWHGHHFKSLQSFNGLAVESITFGGCMGLRDLNRDAPEAQRNSVQTLRNLPNLTSLTLYHSPLTPDDSHLIHIVEHFPKLTELRVDFAPPRGQKVNITADGIAKLAKLKLTYLGLENADTLSPETFAKIGDIKTLTHLHIHPARGDKAEASLASYESLVKTLSASLPDLEITFQKPFVPK